MRFSASDWWRFETKGSSKMVKFLYCVTFYLSRGSKNSLSLRYSARPRKERLDRVHTDLNWFYSQCSIMWMCCTCYRSRRINITNNVVPNNSCSHVSGETSLLKSFVVWVFLFALTLLKLFVTRRPGLWLILTGRTVLCKLISGQTRATSIIHFSLRQWMRCRSIPRYGLKCCSINSWLPDCQSRMKIPLS